MALLHKFQDNKYCVIQDDEFQSLLASHTQDEFAAMTLADFKLWRANNKMQAVKSDNTSHVDANDAHAQIDKPDDDATNARIKDDIKRAQAGISALDIDDRRGLDVETLQRFGFGYLEAWRHPKAPNTMPTARIIAPLGDKGTLSDYNAILTKTDRKRVDGSACWEHQKCLSAGSKLVFNPDDLMKSTVGVTEGEIDCASLWQAAQRGKIINPSDDANSAGFVALGGSGQYTDIINRLRVMETKPRIVIVFDTDSDARKRAEDLRKKLWGIGVVAVVAFLDDVMSDDDKKAVGGKIDANAILQHFGDEKLYWIFARVVAKAKKEFKLAEEELQAWQAAMKANKVDDRPRDNSPEIDALIAKIKDEVPISRLVDKGYLQHSDRGNAHPDGYCCPWCGSGTGTHKTGSMKIFDDRRVGCAKCSGGGDVIKTFAQVKNLPTTGKDFFATLREMCDEFGVTYDPKTFTPPKKKAPTDDDFKTGNADADQWQKANGVFDKQLYLEICASRDFLQGLTPETLTAAVARSKSTARKLALCEFFDFASRAVDKFWATLDVVKQDAAAQIKTATTTGEILSDEVQAAARLNFKDIRAEINRHVTEIRKAHKAFQAELECDKRRAQHKARVADDKTTRTQKLSELESLSKQPQSSDRDKKLVELLRDACEYKENPLSGYRTIRNTAANAKLIFSYDPILNGLTGFDEFQQAEVFLKQPPWRKSLSIGGEIFKDSDAAHVRIYLRETYDEFSNVQLVDDELTVFAHKRSFHPVKDWLRNLPAWDGKPRAETLFIDFLRVDDTPFAREVTLNWLTAALARIAYPGCNYQTALVLHGKQGIGKSYLLERLGVNWYGVLNDSVDDPHAIDDIQNLWIVEMREFRAARKADVNSLKSFIDTAEDNRRAAFARRAERVKRHVVFGITVNDDGFLNDLTGNRRFPVLECKSACGEYIEGLTDEYVAQVWAEVKVKFYEIFSVDGKMIRDLKVVGKLLELSRETKRQVEAVAEKFLRDDGVANEIQGYLDTPRPPQVIWLTFSRDERRKFIEDKKLYVGGGKAELERRIKSRTQRKSSINSDVDELYLLLTPENEGKLFVNAGDGNALILFGTELRNHICAAEIRNECFAPNDKRNNMTRINEILPTIEGWHAGERLRNLDPEYPDQKKVFYRDEPSPDETNKDDTHNEDAPETSHDDFIGEPIDLENPPF